MTDESKSPTLQISDGYRSARRTVSVLCAIALAWSAAQIDIKTISLGFTGSIDLSRATIPLILISAIAYATLRSMLEFAMQSVEVRRWRYAQVDIKVSVFLVQATILILAASGLHRSVDTVLYVALAVLVVLVGSGVAIFLGMMGLTFLLKNKGHTSIASIVFESLAWAELTVVFVVIALLVSLGVASLRYEPLRGLWTVPPSPLALGSFVLACIVVVLSTYLKPMWHRKLFAIPPIFTEQRLPDGRIRRTSHPNPPAVWDWYSQPISEEQSPKEPVAQESPSNKPFRTDPRE